jgi:hypothetical protein
VPEGCAVVDEMLVVTGNTMGAKAEPSFVVAVAVGSPGIDPAAGVMLDAGLGG